MARQSTVGQLSETKVRAAKPKEKAYKLGDGGGLGSRVTRSRLIDDLPDTQSASGRRWGTSAARSVARLEGQDTP